MEGICSVHHFIYTLYRYYLAGRAISICAGLTESDIIYSSLPLYHSNASALAIGAMITMGCTVALRKKFSTRNFWTDCIKYQCTVSSVFAVMGFSLSCWCRKHNIIHMYTMHLTETQSLQFFPAGNSLHW